MEKTENNIQVNSINFPDDIFRQYVADNFDKDNTGVLIEAKLSEITELNVSNMSITSLKGVEHFTNLITLYCFDNQLKSLDINKNTVLTMLWCWNNQLIELDVSNNIALTDLRCYKNQLTSLDLSKNVNLTKLDCRNNKLESLDLSNNTALADLRCENKLTERNYNAALVEMADFKSKKLNMDIFFKEIGEKIKEAVKNDFPIMRKKFENEKPYAAVFHTDSDCITLSLIVNTYESLEKTDTKYAKNGDDETTKWFPDEWGYWSDWNGSGLVKISEELYEKYSSITPGYTPGLTVDQKKALFNQGMILHEESRFTELFFETVTSTFLELIQSNVFDFDAEEITYFISMSDDDRVEEIENNSAKVLNSKKVYKKFLNRFDGVELEN